MPNKRRRLNSRPSPWTVRNIYNAARTAYDGYTRVRDAFRPRSPSSSIQTRPRPRRWDKGGVTAQHDYKLQYVKKRMPKGKRKRWARFVKKVRAVEIGERGLITEVYNSYVPYAATAGTQAILEAHIYSYGGSAKGGSDLSYISKTREVNNPDQEGVGFQTVTERFNASGPVTGTDTGKKAPILFESAVLDITYTNNSDDSVEMDLYYVVYKGRPVVNADQFTTDGYEGLPDYSSLTNMSDQSYAQNNVNKYHVLKAVPGPSNPIWEAKLPIKLSQRGVTMFDNGDVLSRLRCKIIKKEKFIMPPGSSVTKQIRIPKNILFKESIEYNSGFFGKLTQSIFGLAKSVNPEGTTLISQKWTRTYKYTMEGVKTRKMLYLQD